jgi:AcrR family transcriptional regulator
MSDPPTYGRRALVVGVSSSPAGTDPLALIEWERTLRPIIDARQQFGIRQRFFFTPDDRSALLSDWRWPGCAKWPLTRPLFAFDRRRRNDGEAVTRCSGRRQPTNSHKEIAMRHVAPSGRAIAEVSAHRSPAGRSVGSTVVDSTPQSGLPPPQQARSRAALQRLLASAEQVLVNEGPEEFTIIRVAEQAGVSVGGVYRRFASKEQLIDAVRHALLERLEEAVVGALDKAEPSLGGVVDAFTSALSDTLSESGRIIPALLAGGRRVDVPEQGLRIVSGLQQRFVDAVAPHQEQIRHPDPVVALNIAFRTVIATGAHRAAISPWLPDGLTWPQWAHEIAEMTTAYLTAERYNTSPAK